MRTSGLVLFVCAGLMLSGGATLGTSTAWSVLRMWYYLWTTELGVELGAAAMVVAGALLCLPACWLATLVPYYPRSVHLQATLMALVMTSMVVLSVGLAALGGLSRALREPTFINASMLHAMEREPYDPSVRSAFAAMQLELKCCGVSSYADWLPHRIFLPPSCCNRVHNQRAVTDGTLDASNTGIKREQCESPTSMSGCLRPALVELRYFVNNTSALTAALIIILSVSMFAAAYTLVTGLMERNERAKALLAPPLRIACLHNLQAVNMASSNVTPLPPQLSTFNSRVSVPAPQPSLQNL